MSVQSVLDNEQPSIDQPDSPGRRLRIARQAKGLTQDKVATQLHLSQPMIQALESDDFDRLPGPVFVRGYLRNYARLVETDEGAILGAYESHQPSTQEETPRVRPSVQHEIRSSHFGVRLVSWLIVIGLVALLGIWWQGNLTWNGIGVEQETAPPLADTVPDDGSLLLPEPFPQPELEAPTTEAAAPPPPATEAPPLPLVQEETPPQPPEQITMTAPPVDDVQTPVASAPPPLTLEPPAEPQVGADEPAPPTPTQGGVVFEFLGPCWVDIRDSTRKFKLLGEMKEGEKRRLEGTPPYTVILGNSAAVKVTVDGTPFDVEAHSKGNVARFNLDPGAQQ